MPSNIDGLLARTRWRSGTGGSGRYLSTLWDYHNPPERFPEDAKLEGWGQDDPGYSGALRLAFEFFRNNMEGRYSDRTLMTLQRAADRADSNQQMAGDPVVIQVSSPYSFDEETETKRGGVLGMAAVMAAESECTKTCLAVVPSARRHGIGRTLAHIAIDHIDKYTSFWTGPQARGALLFGLAIGLIPRSMTEAGSVAMQYDPMALGAAHRPLTFELESSLAPG